MYKLQFINYGETPWYEIGHFVGGIDGDWVCDSAFPAEKKDAALERLRFLDEDLPLLDGFAKAALTGILASCADADVELPGEKVASKWAYDYAEAMLAERKRRMEAAR